MTPTTSAQDSAPGVSDAGTEPGAVCDDHKVFARDTFARTRRAEVWCDKPKGHQGPHEAVKGSTAFVWRWCAMCHKEPAALGSDICVVCHDAS